MTATVLVVDDDDDLRSLLSIALRDAGYHVLEAAGGVAALDLCTRGDPDLVVLDIGLSDLDGLEVCRRLRSSANIPIVFLTSRADEIDQLVGFAAGADDYITKPFSPQVLLARITSVLRRARSAELAESVTWDGLTLDLAARIANVDSAPVDLTRTEFELLTVLMENPRRVVPRDELVERVWGSWFGDDHVLEVHLSRLRAKVRQAGGPRIAVAVRGVGYKIGVSPAVG